MNVSLGSRPQKTAMILAQRIVSDIAARGNLVGDRLPPERIMLEQYSVGRGTLRESLRFLELQGVISLRPGPGGGPTVEKPDSQALATSLTLLLQFSDAPFRSIAESRQALEPLMAQLAAERMDDETITKLRASVTRMGENLESQEIFLDENQRFHDLIAHGSGNALLGYLIDALLDILDGSAIGIDYPEVRREAVLKWHNTICEAIASHAPAAASSAMAEHISEYLRYAERRFPHVLEARVLWGS